MSSFCCLVGSFFVRGFLSVVHSVRLWFGMVVIGVCWGLVLCSGSGLVSGVCCIVGGGGGYFLVCLLFA